MGAGNNAVDYYTVQNTRNGSIQNSNQQTSRNQNHLATQQIKVNNANPLLSTDQDSLGLASSTMQEGSNSPVVVVAAAVTSRDETGTLQASPASQIKASNENSSMLAGLSTPALLANRSMRSPPRTSVITQQPLKQINEKTKTTTVSNNGGTSGSASNQNNTS